MEKIIEIIVLIWSYSPEYAIGIVMVTLIGVVWLVTNLFNLFFKRKKPEFKDAA